MRTAKTDELRQALAKESKATFINIPISILVSKWFGDSNKLISALFSLAKKLQPTIIFIDEIDSFLRERSSGDHEVTGMMKAEFMSMWDGLTTNNDAVGEFLLPLDYVLTLVLQRILVLGATNRPNDIDQAILRRMPKRFNIKLPNASQRTTILTLVRSLLSPPHSATDLR